MITSNNFSIGDLVEVLPNARQGEPVGEQGNVVDIIYNGEIWIGISFPHAVISSYFKNLEGIEYKFFRYILENCVENISIDPKYKDLFI